ncbi:MAG TPA: RNA methyltransferase [Prolixibacteraceae bacterium]|nr:RNA methyltransferase [Prolixibacteraceae bacterium]
MLKLKNSELNRVDIDTFKKLNKTPIVVVLDNIRSCNNIGSIFRTSDALLIDAIYLCGFTATPPNKEIHKTALDAENSVSWKYYKDTSEAITELIENDYKIYAVEQVANSIMLPDFNPSENEKTALVFGNEIKGVQQKVIDLCHGAIEIPQYGTKHSFNVSVSAGIVLWDVFNKIRIRKFD